MTREYLLMLIKDYGDMERGLGAASVADGHKSREWHDRDMSRNLARIDVEKTVAELFDKLERWPRH